MNNTLQCEGMTITRHGEDVWKHTKKLILGHFEGFILPEWFTKNHHFIVNNLHNWDVIRQYNKLHDCGKPFCLELDAEGKRHFKDHAEVSKKIFLEVFPDRTEVAELIGLDMLLHTCSHHEITALNLDVRTIMTLLITAFAELHSNAKMFGGTESISFKIKYKKLDKLGKRLVSLLDGHQDAHSYIFIRNDLSDAQSVVQAGHAIYEGARYQHPSFVVLSVKNEAKLKKAMELLIDNDIKFFIFREPLLGDTITAICTEPLVEKREVLKHYMLWR